jgi:hypothetical protein
MTVTHNNDGKGKKVKVSPCEHHFYNDEGECLDTWIAEYISNYPDMALYDTEYFTDYEGILTHFYYFVYDSDYTIINELTDLNDNKYDHYYGTILRYMHDLEEISFVKGT